MSSKKNGKDNLKDFIVDDDYMSHEDSDYEDELFYDTYGHYCFMIYG